IKAYEAKSPLSAIRAGLGAERPWDSAEFRSPAPRVSWVARPTAATPAAAPAPAAPAPATAAPVAPTPAAPPPAAPSSRPPAPPPPPPAARTAATPPSSPSAPTQPTAPVVQDIASLIESRALQHASATDAEGAWLESTAQKLRTALLGYGLQAKIVG